MTYRRGGDLLRAQLSGSLQERRVTRPGGGPLHATTAPTMTAGGGFVLFGSKAFVDSNSFRRFASCPAGIVQQVTVSAHGNYAAYTCSGGQAYVSYIGPS